MAIKVKIDFKKAALKKAVAEANFTSLGRAGAYVRTVMRRSIRRRKPGGKPSEPGNAPKSTGRLRDAVLFDVSDQKDDVAIGPTKAGAGLVGKTHEEGGLVIAQQFKFHRAGKGRFSGGKKVTSTVLRDYPKRPFAGPALETSKPRISSFWKSSVSV